MVYLYTQTTSHRQINISKIISHCCIRVVGIQLIRFAAAKIYDFFGFELKCKNRMRRCYMHPHTAHTLVSHSLHNGVMCGAAGSKSKSESDIFISVCEMARNRLRSVKTDNSCLLSHSILGKAKCIERLCEPFSKRNNQQTNDDDEKKIAIRVVNNQKLCKFLHETNSI